MGTGQIRDEHTAPTPVVSPTSAPPGPGLMRDTRPTSGCDGRLQLGHGWSGQGEWAPLSMGGLRRWGIQASGSRGPGPGPLAACPSGNTEEGRAQAAQPRTVVSKWGLPMGVAGHGAQCASPGHSLLAGPSQGSLPWRGRVNWQEQGLQALKPGAEGTPSLPGGAISGAGRGLG